MAFTIWRGVGRQERDDNVISSQSGWHDGGNFGFLQYQNNQTIRVKPGTKPRGLTLDEAVSSVTFLLAQGQTSELEEHQITAPRKDAFAKPLSVTNLGTIWDKGRDHLSPLSRVCVMVRDLSYTPHSFAPESIGTISIMVSWVFVGYTFVASRCANHNAAYLGSFSSD